MSMEKNVHYIRHYQKLHKKFENAIGSFYRTPLDERLCACNEIQTLHHVIFHCVLIEPICYDGFPQTLGDFFDNSSNAAASLRLIERILNLR